jgi:hypothetical protein
LNDGFILWGNLHNATYAASATAAQDNDHSSSSSNVTFAAMQWKTEFSIFQDAHHDQIKEYLATGPFMAHKNASFDHLGDNTELFWRNVSSETKPTRQDLASVALARLGRLQLIRIQTYLRQLVGAKSEKTAWQPQSKSFRDHFMHLTIERCQQEVRSVTDQQDLFQDFFIPAIHEPDKSMVLLKETRALLQSISEDWQKLVDDYELPKKTSKEKTDQRKTKNKLRHSMNMQWKSFQWWVKVVALDGVLQDLINGMDERSHHYSP